MNASSPSAIQTIRCARACRCQLTRTRASHALRALGVPSAVSVPLTLANSAPPRESINQAAARRQARSLRPLLAEQVAEDGVRLVVQRLQVAHVETLLQHEGGKLLEEAVWFAGLHHER